SLTTADFIAPASDNHAVAKSLALRLVGEVGIEIDEGVYDRVRLWRAVNSRHRRTGRHKGRIGLDDLLFLNAGQVRRLAAGPIPYDPPAPPSPPPRLVGDWGEVAVAVRGERERQVRHDAPNREARHRINPLTWALLTDPTSIRVGERHKTIL